MQSFSHEHVAKSLTSDSSFVQFHAFDFFDNQEQHESSASTVTSCSVLCRRLAAEVLQDGVQVPLHHRRFMMNAVLEWLLKLNVYERFLDIVL